VNSYLIMNLTELFLNKYFASIFIIGTSFYVYCRLRKPWGLVLPAIALIGISIFTNISSNSAINYMIIGGIYGFLPSISGWIKRKFINKM
jgi:hypothetical protein